MMHWHWAPPPDLFRLVHLRIRPPPRWGLSRPHSIARLAVGLVPEGSLVPNGVITLNESDAENDK